MAFDFDLGDAGRAASAIVGLTVVMLITAALLPQLFTATGDVNSVFADNASDLNETAAADIAEVMPVIIGVLVIFAIVALIARAVQKRGG